MTAYVDTLSLRDKKSWHGKEMETGGIFTGVVNIWDQMKKTMMDYIVHLSPNYFEWNGELIEVDNRYHVVVPITPWNPKPSSIRQVGNRYNIIQNEYIAKLLEPLNEKWPVEGMGVLKGGRIVFVQLKMEPFCVGNNEKEEHNIYLQLANDHVMGSLNFGETVTRTVCANTYKISLQDDTMNFIPHSTDIVSELEFQVAIIKNSLDARTEQKTLLDLMFRRPIEKEELATVIEAAFPDPKFDRATRIYNAADPLGLDQNDSAIATMAERSKLGLNKWEIAMTRQNDLRMDVGAAFTQFNDEQPYCGGTVYAAWNAVTQVVNHSPKFYGGNEKGMVSLFFGQKKTMLDAAYKTCIELVK